MKQCQHQQFLSIEKKSGQVACAHRHRSCLVMASELVSQPGFCNEGHASMMKVRVGRCVSSPAPASVQDLMSASVSLMISRTVKPEGPANACSHVFSCMRAHMPVQCKQACSLLHGCMPVHTSNHALCCMHACLHAVTSGSLSNPQQHQSHLWAPFPCGHAVISGARRTAPGLGRHDVQRRGVGVKRAPMMKPEASSVTRRSTPLQTGAHQPHRASAGAQTHPACMQAPEHACKAV